MRSREKPVIEALFWASAWVQPCRVRRYGRAAVAMPILLAACVLASAQTATTTISGTVYDPRGAGGLPLPSVLVYVSATPVAAPTPGVQCLTAQDSTPTSANVVAYTYTNVQGNFTLQNIPENASYTIVIQAGKWQRQFPETVAAVPLAGLVLSMPANHTQGNIPMIAIATGGAERMECVFRDMGISDSEFTDDTGSVNPGGRIHLYEGSGKPISSEETAYGGAVISASTPSETLLMEGASTTPLNAYDMAMFPSQGGSSSQATPEGATNLLNFADGGGRIFANDTSYVWLDPAERRPVRAGSELDRNGASPRQLRRGNSADQFQRWSNAGAVA